MQYLTSFQDAVMVCLKKYKDFNGRAGRAEYWWFYLFHCLVVIVLGLLSQFLASIANLILFLPGLAAAVRRLHDRGFSGWWMLLALTVIGVIPLLVMLALPSDPRVNQYGDVTGHRI